MCRKQVKGGPGNGKLPTQWRPCLKANSIMSRKKVGCWAFKRGTTINRKTFVAKNFHGLNFCVVKFSLDGPHLWKFNMCTVEWKANYGKLRRTTMELKTFHTLNFYSLRQVQKLANYVNFLICSMLHAPYHLTSMEGVTQYVIHMYVSVQEADLQYLERFPEHFCFDLANWTRPTH